MNMSNQAFLYLKYIVLGNRFLQHFLDLSNKIKLECICHLHRYVIIHLQNNSCAFQESGGLECITYAHFLIPSFPLTLRHLDYFEMLRNEDELALSKRFESVSKRKHFSTSLVHFVLVLNIFFFPSVSSRHT